MTAQVIYPGTDLEAMSAAARYPRWIVDEFRASLGRHVVEVGAGAGAISALLLAEAPETLTLVEPSAMFTLLTTNVPARDTAPRVRHHQALFADISPQLTPTPDTVVYVNVLEHVADDEAELRLIWEALSPGGRCLVFVPALRSLYSPFDRRLGHYRRYSKKELVAKSESAGFEVLSAKYFDVAGVLPWFVRFRVLRASGLGAASVAAYDRWVVPVTRRVERLIRAPFGKNVLAVLAKPHATD
jgi:SAM-dependent methyltransferase